MTYKFYNDKSSVLKKNSKYVQGGNTDIFAKRLGWWEKRTDIVKDDITDIKYIITRDFDKRPDRLAFAYYGRNDLKWIILQYNNIVDISEQFITGKSIVIPSPARVFTEILTKPVIYQAL